MKKIDDAILEVQNIVKTFPGVTALDNVTETFERASIHALVGENGAGKSTLMKLIAGVYKPDQGEVIYEGKSVDFDNPRDAQSLGIAIIYQEFNLLPNLNVAENIVLGQEPLQSNKALIDKEKQQEIARETLDRLGVHLDLNTPIWRLSVAEQQMVEIAKALARDAKLIIMDEPSAMLVGKELERLFDIIRSLKSQGVTVLYVSHRLNEIFRLADHVTVLKDGEHTGAMDISETDRETLIRLMVGRSLSETFPVRENGIGDRVLSLENVSTGGALHDINLKLHKGEILGIAGLVGAGRTELANAIFGIENIREGQVKLNGQVVHIKNPDQAIKQRMGYVTENRKEEGLIMTQTVRKNVALPSLDRRQWYGVVNEEAEREVTTEVFNDLEIIAPGIDHPVRSLSGGNQQKVVLAKWLVTDSDILIFDEPTRGIDVGAKAEIYNLMRDLADQGKAIIMISSELPEILGMSDRVLVMSEGEITGELSPEQATEEQIMSLATRSIRENREPDQDSFSGSKSQGEQPSPGFSSLIKNWWAQTDRTVLTIYGILLLMILLGTITSSSFRSLRNFQNILRQSVALGLVSIGQTFVIINGGIDISIGSVVTLTAVISAGIMNGSPAMIVPALLASLAIGVVVGLTNGWLVTKLDIPHFVATFGTWSVVRGLVLVYTRGPVGFIPEGFRYIAAGQVGPIPFPALAFGLIFTAAVVVLRKTRLGRYIRSVGGGIEVARLSGVRTKKVQQATFLISSLMGVLAGLFLAARMSVGDPNVGVGLEWDSVASAVVGGADWLGWGSLVGTLSGVFMVTTLSNVMNQLNVNFWYQQVLKGLIILIAVVIYRQMKKR